MRKSLVTDSVSTAPSEKVGRKKLLNRTIATSKYIGKKFGRLKITGETQEGYNYRFSYVCSCGTKGIANKHSVLCGTTKSCGCLPREIAPKNLIKVGDKFSKWTVLQIGSGRERHYPLCLCECGETAKVYRFLLIEGSSKSCGCYRDTRAKERATTHGLSKSKVYKVWQAMLHRCENKNARCYPRYGGRGIVVCDRWKKFENFYSDMGDRPTPKHQIDRINNNLGYSPDNCRWATQIENGRNKRNNRHLTFQGKTLTVAEWSDVTGLRKSVLYRRIYRDWPTQKILTTPIKNQKGRSR